MPAKRKRQAQKTFQEVLTDAIADMTEHGFDSAERVDGWVRELRLAAERTLTPIAELDQQLRDGLTAIYRRLVDHGGAISGHKAAQRFTLDRIRPTLRSELDRRILSSANLIKLNRAEAIEKTLRRFHGWSTSIPVGGVSGETKAEVKADVRKALSSLPFEERRVLIDQGAKLTASINDIVSKDGGAIAGEWRSHWKSPGYQYRPEHKERDGRIFLIKDSWAHRAGLVRRGSAGFTDEISQPAQEPFCLPGDAQIDFFDDCEKIYRRPYTGAMITLRTDDGAVLRATPNHPVMTPNGWIAIGLLNEGDSVIQATDKGIKSAKLNANQECASFVNLFETMRQVGFGHEIRDGMRMNFHGDGSDADIDIISLDRPLRLYGNSKVCESVDNLALSLADFVTALIFGSFCQFNGRAFFATNGIMSLGSRNLAIAGSRNDNRIIFNGLKSFPDGFMGNAKDFGECFNWLSRFVSRHKIIGINFNLFDAAEARPKIDKPIYMPFPQGHGANANSFGNFIERLPFQAKLANVVEVNVNEFSGHVYNLQTKSGWYVGNRIIVSNCRCYYRFLYSPSELPDEMLTAKGREALKAARSGQNIKAAFSVRSDLVDNPQVGLLVEVSRHYDRFDYLTGINAVRAGGDSDKWHSHYDPDADEIVLHHGFFSLDPVDQVHTMLHEIGHRGQYIDKPAYDAFKESHLNQVDSFVDMANKAHLEDYERTGNVDGGLTSEVFAESYARWCLDLPMPETLLEFWNISHKAGE